MPTIEELLNLDPSKFAGAAEGWAKVSGRARAAKDRVEHEMLAQLRATQQGEAAESVTGTLTKLSNNYQYIHAECALVETALKGLSEELVSPQRKLKQALDEAQQLKFTVKPDGSVEYPRSPSTPAPLLQQPAQGGQLLLQTDDANHAKAQEIADRIGEALKEATEIDGRYAQALSKLQTNSDLTKTDWADVSQDLKAVQSAAGKHFSADAIPKGKSPKDNAAWWQSLTDEQRNEYAALYPAAIGALDGLPATVRDDANRIVLAETRANLAERIRGLEANEPQKFEPKYNNITGLPLQGVQAVTSGWEKWSAEKEDLEKKLKGIDAIQQRVERAGKDQRDLPEAYLLGFDAVGRGHAIVANGNPDVAQHTAVYVPGTGARLEDIPSGINRSGLLWRASAAKAPGDTVSTITWYGYDAPQDVVKDSPFSHYADDAAGNLNGFLSGLNASHSSSAGHHLTAIGHSYGTVVVGSAARQGDLPVSDVIFAGSPGVQLGRASDFPVPQGHVWNEHADKGDELVGTFGRLAHGGAQPPGPSGIKQVIPDDVEFGARQMATDTEGHGGYWDYDADTHRASLSLENQAKVVVGQYGEVKLKNSHAK
ncbi:alpha/beta hydrolase [Streptomyces gamaensis]|uniref:Alpha/beta hydrolase n=1 Tax=Streptomyces gamaensis TaxID=1763542 RepID=A0ABW0Z4N0_9ACTN